MPELLSSNKKLATPLLVPPQIRRHSKKVPTTVSKVGKRSGQLLAATSATGHPTSHLLFLTDNNSECHFLIDTGAEVSVIPPSTIDWKNKQDLSELRAVNGSPITMYGTRSLMLDLGLRHAF